VARIDDQFGAIEKDRLWQSSRRLPRYALYVCRLASANRQIEGLFDACR
jgi:hypothetical protein